MKHFIIIKLMSILLIFCQVSGKAQDIAQNIRGSVVDRLTHNPLQAATVAVYSDSVLVGATISDTSGDFRIGNIHLGRYSIVVSYIGYRQAVIPDIIVNSTKEIVLPVELEESTQEIKEISINATAGKGNAINKLAYASARTFSAEESERFAGSRGDPARMASNFAGVQGNDDSNNDLVIRGNSPLGVLWRMDGVNIPNPNHFGVSGTTGGPVSILNNKVLSLSDFMSGAFPAEYGNSVAGVFDLRMRNGNNEKNEFSAQLGFLGTEISAEGPLSDKGKSSYLAAYRYSTMAIFQALGINIGTDAVPKYQDLSFKLNFPTNKKGNISLFGIGGVSAIDILASEQLDPKDDAIFGDEAMNEHFRTGMGVLGANYSRTFGTDSYIKLTLSSSLEHQSNHLDKVYRHIEDGFFKIDSIMEPHNGYHSNTSKHSVSFNWNKRINKEQSIRAGITSDIYIFDMLDSIFNESYKSYKIRLNHSGPAFLLLPYLQWKINPSEKINYTAGLHGQVLNLAGNMSKAVEPRLGFKYQINSRNSLGFSSGLHSQMLPAYIYFAILPEKTLNDAKPNMGLDFIKSYHNVLTWDHAISQKMRIKLETYYQYLFNVPVEYSSSSYSVLDEGHDLSRFFPDSLVNKGKGQNMGMEFTLEKFFSNSYFLMFTSSLYDSKRTGSNGKSYDAIFNGRYIVNALGSKEFSWGENRKSTFTIGGKITLAGGKRYTPINIAASDIAGEAVYFDEQRNSMKFSHYFRADIKLNYRVNARNTTHEAGLDIINITNRENILKQTYVHGGDPAVRELNQLGMLPLFYYKIDF